MRNAALSGCLGLGFLIASVGCEPVDDGASTRNKGWDGVLTDHVLPSDRGVFIDVNETETVADGCAKTEMDALKVLQDNCAGCHAKPYSTGLPPFDFILEPEKLKMATWPREGQAAMPFVKPGDAAGSAIYLRAAINQTMPPVYDASLPTPARVTYSGASVLYQWITHCM